MRILFATDGSEGASAALELLCALPLAPQHEVRVLSVAAPTLAETLWAHDRATLQRPIAAQREHAEAVAAVAVRRLRERGVCARSLVLHGAPVDNIYRAALDENADLVVVGSRGLGAIAGAVFGSTARALARLAPFSLLVVRGHLTAPRRVLLALDGSADAATALDLIVALPLPADAAITVMHVGDGEPNEIAAMLRRAEAMLGSRGTLELRAERGRVAQRIVTTAQTMGADLVVLGSRGDAHDDGLLRGSVADQVLSQARRAMLVAKRRPAWLSESATARLALASQANR